MARVFRDPSLHSPKSAVHTNEQTKRVISGAQLGFHDALDELEIEIVSLKVPLPVIVTEALVPFKIRTRRQGHDRPGLAGGTFAAKSTTFGLGLTGSWLQRQAMAVMESDLATLQSHRAKREQEASVGRAVTGAAPGTEILQQSRQVSTDAATADKLAGEGAKAADTITDPLIKFEAPGHLDQQSKMTSEISLKAESPVPREKQDPDPPIEAKPAPSKDPATTSDDKAAENQPGKETEPENARSVEVPVLDESQASANIKDLDFDSMFDDTVGDGGNDDMNFDMDFPTHAGNSEALLVDNSFAANAISGKASALPGGPIEDIDSLLPGLESFANATDDFAMVNIGTTPASAESTVNAVPTAAKVAEVPPDLLPPESNFDDMFFGSVDFPMGEGNGGGTGDDDFGELGDFDESWFKTDGA